MRTAFVTALLALSAPVPAAAQRDIMVEALPTAVIQVGDLDSATKSGQRTFARRLGIALETVCGSYAGLAYDSEVERITDCRTAAKSTAYAQLADRGSRLAAGATIRIAARRP